MIKLDLKNAGISDTGTIHIPLHVQGNEFYFLNKSETGLSWKDIFYEASESRMNYNVCEQEFHIIPNKEGSFFYVTFKIKDIKELNKEFITYLLEYFKKCELIANETIINQAKLREEIGDKLKKLSKLEILK